MMEKGTAAEEEEKEGEEMEEGRGLVILRWVGMVFVSVPLVVMLLLSL